MSTDRCPTPREVCLHGRARQVGCGRRSCQVCGVLWLGDTRIRVLAACQELRGAVALVTVTAPGADRLPWAPGGRQVDAEAAREWNASAPSRWSQAHRRAARVARDVAAEAGAEWRLLVKVWEYQRRGVLHLHLLLPTGSAAEYRASTAYVTELAAIAGVHGFGFVDRGKLPMRGARRSSRRLERVDPHRAAAYVSSYVASSGAGKEGIAEVARKQGVPGAIVYVSQRLTSRSGVTMRSLRLRRAVACRWPESTTSPTRWRAACVLHAMTAGRPPMTAEATRALGSRAMAERWTASVDVGTGEVRGPTPAAQPAAVRDAVEASQPRVAVAVVRLDSVLHRGPHDAILLPYTTCEVLATRR